MHFTSVLVAAATFAAAQAAKIGNAPASFVGVTAGSTLNITWFDATGPVSLLLKKGPATALTNVATISNGLTGTSYLWPIPTTLATDTYAIQIDDNSGVPNYSIQFLISGITVTTSSVVSSSATSASSSAITSSVSSSAATTSAPTTATTGNSTATGSTTKTTTSSGTKSSTSSTAAPATTANVNSAAGIASPLAFVLLAFAAIITLN